jgi:actin, other eukaryote
VRRGVFKIRLVFEEPIRKDRLERLWEDVFRNQLRVSPEEHAILLTDSPNATLSDRETMADVMFNHFTTPALCILMDARLSIYSSTFKTGLVLDCGQDHTFAVPIFSGSPKKDAIMECKLGGSTVTDGLRLTTHTLSKNPNEDLMHWFKEQHCYVAQDYQQELSLSNPSTFVLPDGEVITIGDER